MIKIIYNAPNQITPFNEPARDLRVQNRPIWFHQREVLSKYVTGEIELKHGEKIPQKIKVPLGNGKGVRDIDIRDAEIIAYRDNLFFDKEYIDEFISLARKKKGAVRAAFSANDLAFIEHALPLSTSYTVAGDLYLADLWYFPKGPAVDAEPLRIDLDTTEVGYYQVPTYMADESGKLTFQIPRKAALIAIDSWVHVFIADIVFGLFARAERYNHRSNEDLLFKLEILFKALYEGVQILRSSPLVKIGKNCRIHPSVVIGGPATIGDNVKIEEGVVIDNCIIGNNVNISQGCQLMLSVVGDGAFLPFGAKLFMTTIMENSMVAQNTCLQMCVIGRNTFIGAGSTFTDYNLIPAPIRALDGEGRLKLSNRPVLGSAVGHNCRIGSGMVVYPARTIESDVVLAASKERRVIDKNVRYEDSDHHKYINKGGEKHKRLYPREDEGGILEEWR